MQQTRSQITEQNRLAGLNPVLQAEKNTPGIYINASNNKAIWEQGRFLPSDVQRGCIVTSRECLSGHKVVHGNSSCSWSSVPPTAPKNEQAGNEC